MNLERDSSANVVSWSWNYGTVMLLGLGLQEKVVLCTAFKENIGYAR